MATYNQEAVDQELKEQAKKEKLGKLLRILGPVGVVCIILSFRFDDLINGGLPVKLVGIVVCIVLSIVGKRMQKSAKAQSARQITVPMLESAAKETFEKVFYSSQNHMPLGNVNIDMGIPGRYSTLRGNNYIKAEYQGVPLELSNVRLTEEGEVTKEDGISTQEVEYLRFEGLWVMLHTRKEHKEGVLIKARAGLTSKFSKTDYVTENEAFDKKFCVKTADKQEAQSILHPSMIEYILDTAAKTKGDLYLRFMQDGRVCMAINIKKNFFDTEKIKGSTQEMHDGLKARLDYVTGLINCI